MDEIRTSRASRQRPLWKLAAAAFVLLSLLTGGVEVHNHGARAASYEGLGAATRFTPAAAHPNLPHHIEAGDEAERPSCPACLHSLATRGTQLARAVMLHVETGSFRLPLAPDLHPSDPSAHWIGGRSPPLV
ncbi:MAG TPA: hypothetical protein VFE33_04870 [Thermoanaerobaculia bacterium]|nr:hypothetical protein [Thermoanaerobaculia bacterium]